MDNPVVTDIVQVVMQNGILGTILAWFMFRIESQIRHLNDSIERQTRAIVQLLERLGAQGSASRLSEE